MEKRRIAVAGTLESSDVLVQITPSDAGNNTTINSVVKNQFEEQINNTVDEMIIKFNMKNINLNIDDQGAIDLVLRARLETAFKRYGDINE